MAARNPWTMDSTALAAWQPGWRPAPKASAQARSIAPLRIEPRRAKPAPQASAVQPFHGPYPPLGADDFIAPVASATGSYALAAWR
ncbi:MAG: hypothetical protein C0606_14080 [Hyphomicrobiales bacterium]|nr:MAG: hypothetical protein C0606_14080 [Hyphomicrobiales bacterium]